MENYETQYEEYKKSLLHETWFRSKLNDLYRGSLSVEKDYISENGVLWKIGLLGAICGYFIAFTPVENGNWMLGIFLVLGIFGSIIWAWHIGNKFKNKSGERNFYSFQYHKYIKDRVQKDKDKEAYNLMRDIWEHYEAILWRVDSIQTMPEEDVKSLLLYHIKKMGDFKKRHTELDRFDGFASDLQYDWYFNTEIQKDIDKYF